MVCGHGVQLSGSFHCIQSWCQYSAGPRRRLGEHQQGVPVGKVAEPQLLERLARGRPLGEPAHDRVVGVLDAEVGALVPGVGVMRLGRVEAGGLLAQLGDERVGQHVRHHAESIADHLLLRPQCYFRGHRWILLLGSDRGRQPRRCQLLPEARQVGQGSELPTPPAARARLPPEPRRGFALLMRTEHSRSTDDGPGWGDRVHRRPDLPSGRLRRCRFDDTMAAGEAMEIAEIAMVGCGGISHVHARAALRPGREGCGLPPAATPTPNEPAPGPPSMGRSARTPAWRRCSTRSRRRPCCWRPGPTCTAPRSRPAWPPGVRNILCEKALAVTGRGGERDLRPGARRRCAGPWKGSCIATIPRSAPSSGASQPAPWARWTMCAPRSTCGMRSWSRRTTTPGTGASARRRPAACRTTWHATR